MAGQGPEVGYVVLAAATREIVELETEATILRKSAAGPTDLRGAAGGRMMLTGTSPSSLRRCGAAALRLVGLGDGSPRQA